MVVFKYYFSFFFFLLSINFQVVSNEVTQNNNIVLNKNSLININPNNNNESDIAINSSKNNNNLKQTCLNESESDMFSESLNTITTTTEHDMKHAPKKKFFDGILSSLTNFIRSPDREEKYFKSVSPNSQTSAQKMIADDIDLNKLLIEEDNVSSCGSKGSSKRKAAKSQGRKESDAGLRKSKRDELKLTQAMKQIDSKKFSENMSSIQSQISSPKVDCKNPDRDLSKFFPDKKEDKLLRQPKNKEVKSLKDVNMLKYFPGSPTPDSSEGSPMLSRKKKSESPKLGKNTGKRSPPKNQFLRKSPPKSPQPQKKSPSPYVPRKNKYLVKSPVPPPENDNKPVAQNTSSRPNTPLAPKKNILAMQPLAKPRSITPTATPQMPRKNVLALQSVSKVIEAQKSFDQHKFDQLDGASVTPPLASQHSPEDDDSKMFEKIIVESRIGVQASRGPQTNGKTNIKRKSNIYEEDEMVFEKLMDNVHIERSPSRDYNELFSDVDNSSQQELPKKKKEEVPSKPKPYVRGEQRKYILTDADIVINRRNVEKMEELEELYLASVSTAPQVKPASRKNSNEAKNVEQREIQNTKIPSRKNSGEKKRYSGRNSDDKKRTVQSVLDDFENQPEARNILESIEKKSEEILRKYSEAEDSRNQSRKNSLKKPKTDYNDFEKVAKEQNITPPALEEDNIILKKSEEIRSKLEAYRAEVNQSKDSSRKNSLKKPKEAESNEMINKESPKELSPTIDQESIERKSEEILRKLEAYTAEANTSRGSSRQNSLKKPKTDYEGFERLLTEESDSSPSLKSPISRKNSEELNKLLENSENKILSRKNSDEISKKLDSILIAAAMSRKNSTESKNYKTNLEEFNKRFGDSSTFTLPPIKSSNKNEKPFLERLDDLKLNGVDVRDENNYANGSADEKSPESPDNVIVEKKYETSAAPAADKNLDTRPNTSNSVDNLSQHSDKNVEENTHDSGAQDLSRKNSDGSDNLKEFSSYIDSQLSSRKHSGAFEELKELNVNKFVAEEEKDVKVTTPPRKMENNSSIEVVEIFDNIHADILAEVDAFDRLVKEEMKSHELKGQASAFETLESMSELQTYKAKTPVPAANEPPIVKRQKSKSISPDGKKILSQQQVATVIEGETSAKKSPYENCTPRRNSKEEPIYAKVNKKSKSQSKSPESKNPSDVENISVATVAKVEHIEPTRAASKSPEMPKKTYGDHVNILKDICSNIVELEYYTDEPIKLNSLIYNDSKRMETAAQAVQPPVPVRREVEPKREVPVAAAIGTPLPEEPQSFHINDGEPLIVKPARQYKKLNRELSTSARSLVPEINVEYTKSISPPEIPKRTKKNNKHLFLEVDDARERKPKPKIDYSSDEDYVYKDYHKSKPTKTEYLYDTPDNLKRFEKYDLSISKVPDNHYNLTYSKVPEPYTRNSDTSKSNDTNIPFSTMMLAKKYQHFDKFMPERILSTPTLLTERNVGGSSASKKKYDHYRVERPLSPVSLAGDLSSSVLTKKFDYHLADRNLPAAPTSRYERPYTTTHSSVADSSALRDLYRTERYVPSTVSYKPSSTSTASISYHLPHHKLEQPEPTSGYLLDRSKMLHQRKQEYLDEKIGERNPYIKEMLRNERYSSDSDDGGYNKYPSPGTSTTLPATSAYSTHTGRMIPTTLASHLGTSSLSNRNLSSNTTSSANTRAKGKDKDKDKDNCAIS